MHVLGGFYKRSAPRAQVGPGRALVAWACFPEAQVESPCPGTGRGAACSPRPPKSILGERDGPQVTREVGTQPFLEDVKVRRGLKSIRSRTGGLDNENRPGWRHRLAPRALEALAPQSNWHPPKSIDRTRGPCAGGRDCHANAESQDHWWRRWHGGGVAGEHLGHLTQAGASGEVLPRSPSWAGIRQVCAQNAEARVGARHSANSPLKVEVRGRGAEAGGKAGPVLHTVVLPRGRHVESSWGHSLCGRNTHPGAARLQGGLWCPSLLVAPPQGTRVPLCDDLQHVPEAKECHL